MKSCLDTIFWMGKYQFTSNSFLDLLSNKYCILKHHLGGILQGLYRIAVWLRCQLHWVPLLRLLRTQLLKSFFCHRAWHSIIVFLSLPTHKEEDSSKTSPDRGLLYDFQVLRYYLWFCLQYCCRAFVHVPFFGLKKTKLSKRKPV